MSEANGEFIKDFGRVKFVGGSRELAVKTNEEFSKPSELLGVTEIEKTPEMLKKIEAIQEEIVKWGAELGFDLKSRLPGLSKYHLYSESEFNKVRESQNLSVTNRGFRSWTNDVSLPVGDKIQDVLHTIDHETLHAVSKDVVSLCDVEVNRLGYENKNNKTFATVNEALTEMANIFIQHKYWKEVDTEPAYLEAIVLMDGMIRDVAKFQNMEISKVFEMAEKGLLSGKMGFIKLLSANFGRGRMFPLARLSDSFDDPKRVAKLFGLEKTVEKIEKLQANEPVLIMEGIVEGGVVVSF